MYKRNYGIRSTFTFARKESWTHMTIDHRSYTPTTQIVTNKNNVHVMRSQYALTMLSGPAIRLTVIRQVSLALLCAVKCLHHVGIQTLCELLTWTCLPICLVIRGAWSSGIRRPLPLLLLHCLRVIIIHQQFAFMSFSSDQDSPAAVNSTDKNWDFNIR